MAASFERLEPRWHEMCGVIPVTGSAEVPSRKVGVAILVVEVITGLDGQSSAGAKLGQNEARSERRSTATGDIVHVMRITRALCFLA